METLKTSGAVLASVAVLAGAGSEDRLLNGMCGGTFVACWSRPVVAE